jgi:hypothetical protein
MSTEELEIPGRLPVTKDIMVEKKKRGLKKTTIVKRPAKRWSARVTETKLEAALETAKNADTRIEEA